MEPPGHSNIKQRKILVEVALKKEQLEVQILELSKQKAESEVRHALLLERKAAAEFDIIAKAENRGSLWVENKTQQATVPELHSDILGGKSNKINATEDSDLLSRPGFLTKATSNAPRHSPAPLRQIATPTTSHQTPTQLSGQSMMLLQSIQTSFSWNATSLQDRAIVLLALQATLTEEGKRPGSGLLEEEVVAFGTRKRGRSRSSVRSSEDEEDSGDNEHLELSDP